MPVMIKRAVPVVWHGGYEVDIGPHVFPTAKYRLVRDRLLRAGVINEANLHAPSPVDDDAISLAHTDEYLRKIRLNTLSPEERMLLEVPFSVALREAMWLCAGGTVLAGRLALANRAVAVHLGGGFHHAFADHGEGFCLINDVAVAIRMLQRESAGQRFAVLDCDVHHGNGTAALFAGDADVFTFSIHQENNYPYYKPRSDLDIGLADGTGDDAYLAHLKEHVPAILERHRPHLVFYLAGADPYRNDLLGGLGLTLAGLARRDRLVFECCRSAGVPVAVTLAGGYAMDSEDTVRIHCGTVVATDAERTA